MAGVFAPAGNTVTLSVTGTTGRVARTAPTTMGVVRVVNAGPNVAFMEFGDVTIEATAAAGMPILPGSAELFAMSDIETDVAAICATGETATLYITSGIGE